MFHTWFLFLLPQIARLSILFFLDLAIHSFFQVIYKLFDTIQHMPQDVSLGRSIVTSFHLKEKATCSLWLVPLFTGYFSHSRTFAILPRSLILQKAYTFLSPLRSFNEF